MKIGDKILLCRKEAGLSQEQLASRLNISRQAVSRWETGEATPETEKIIQLSRLFGVSTDYLLLEELEKIDSSICSMNQQADSLKKCHRNFQLTIGKILFAVGLITFFISLILAVLYAELLITTWYTELGKLGTALFRSYLTLPLILGLIMPAAGGEILWKEYIKKD